MKTLRAARFFGHLAFTKVAQILSCMSFFFPKKRASQGLTDLYVNNKIFLVLAMFFVTSLINPAESGSLQIKKVSKLPAFDLFS